MEFKKERALEHLKKALDPSQYKTPETFTEEETLAAIRQAMIAELDAINLYEAHLHATKDERLQALLRHIIEEEQHHVEELKAYLDFKEKIEDHTEDHKE